MAFRNQSTESADPQTQTGLPPSSSDTTLSEALLVLRKRKWVLLAAVIFGVALGFYRAISQPVVYLASGKIEVRAGSSNQYRVDPGGSVLDSNTKLSTEVAIIQSDSLAMQIAREMDLANNPAFASTGPVRRNLDNPIVRQKIIRALHLGLRVAPMSHTDIITISYAASNPQLAADIVNHCINGYIQRSYETRFASTQRISQWLSEQLDDLKHQVETSQEQLIDLQKQLGVLGLGFDASKSETTTTNALDALSRAATEARIARILAESKYRVVSTADPSVLEGTNELVPGTANGELARLRSEITEAKADIARQRQIYGPEHPLIKAANNKIGELQREIDVEQGRITTTSQQAYVAAKSNEAQTAAALEAAKNDAYKLRDDLVEYTLRQREYESNRSLYEGLLSRLRAAGVQAGLESLEIDIVDPALPPAQQTLAPRSGIIITTVVFSLIGGIILVFLMESLDTGLRSVAEIESFTGLPSLAVIPRARKTVSEASAGQSIAVSNIGVLSTSKSQFSEAFRALRTSLLLATTGHPPKIIMVASATPSEGKTTIATNLACILAQRDTRVLLIDSDLRRPNVHHRFGLTGKVGLSTVLTGSVSLQEAIQNVPEVPNLDILPSGPVPPFPTEMLSSDTMHELLARCATMYSHIVLDSPPILSVTDGVILARQADAVALVVRHGKSSRHIVRRGRDLLARAGAPVTGVILNAVDINSPEYYGYYGYSGYAYSNVDTETWDIEERKRMQAAQKEHGE